MFSTDFADHELGSELPKAPSLNDHDYRRQTLSRADAFVELLASCTFRASLHAGRLLVHLVLALDLDAAQLVHMFCGHALVDVVLVHQVVELKSSVHNRSLDHVQELAPRLALSSSGDQSHISTEARQCARRIKLCHDWRIWFIQRLTASRGS